MRIKYFGGKNMFSYLSGYKVCPSYSRPDAWEEAPEVLGPPYGDKSEEELEPDEPDEN